MEGDATTPTPASTPTPKATPTSKAKASKAKSAKVSSEKSNRQASSKAKEQETVLVEESSDEELDSAIAGLDNPDDESDSGEENSPEDDESSEVEEDDSDSEENEDSESEAGEDRESDDKDKQPKKEAAETEASLRKKLEKKERENQANQNFIQRANQRYGALAKEIREEIAGLSEQAKGLEGVEANEAAIRLVELKKKLVHTLNEKSLFEHVVKTKAEVESTIPEEEFSIEGMVDILEEDGDHDPEYVAKFKKSPYQMAHSHEIRLLHKASKYKRVAMAFAGALKKARTENEKLKKRPQSVVDGIEKVARTSAGVTGKNGGGSGNQNGKFRSLTNAEIANLEDKELDDALAALE